MDTSISNDRLPDAEMGDAELGARFLDTGYVIQPSEDRAALDRIRLAAAQAAARTLSVSLPADIGGFLNTIHEHVGVADLNGFRLAVLDALLADPAFRPSYFACGRKTVEAIVGNELAMQRNIGFSIQLPNVHRLRWCSGSPWWTATGPNPCSCCRPKTIAAGAAASMSSRRGAPMRCSRRLSRK
jgi:hypothetical protein